MKRTTKPLPIIPDAVNASPKSSYTMIPNEMLRDPQISYRAKGLLCLLLSNKEGWKSYVSQIAKNSKEGVDAIQTGLRELEKFGYVMRLKYREKVSKIWVGSLWVYSGTPYCFDLKDSLLLLGHRGLEIPNIEKRLRQNISPERGSPDLGNPELGNPVLKIYNSKNTKITTTSEVEDVDLKKAVNGYITPKDFFKFKQIYPKNRGASDGTALTAWEKLCHNSTHRPTWNRIERAIKKQKETPRWQNPKFIPLASTWLNQKRWLDDPALMIAYETDQSNEDQMKREKEANEAEWRRHMGYDKDED